MVRSYLENRWCAPRGKSLSQARPPNRHQRRSLLSRFRRDEEGVAAVEFAIVALPFFMLLMFIFEMGLSYFANKVLAMSTDAVARQIRVGELVVRSGPTDTDTAAAKKAFQDRLCDYSGMDILFDCDKLIVDVRVVSEFGDAPGTPGFAEPDEADPNDDGGLDPDQFSFDSGGRLTINVVRVFYEWENLMDYANTSTKTWVGNKRMMMAVSAFRTEPF
ncbi:MAG: TadE/TadG family type IV pilus assembly protein [Pseudomonadota bacterium]